MKQFQSVEDIVMDSSFRRWVVHNDPEAQQQWQVYLAQQPEHTELVEQAKQILQELPDIKYRMSDALLHETWSNIASAVDISGKVTNSSEAKSRRLQSTGLLIAASFTGLALLSFILWFTVTDTDQNTYQTAYGETQRLLLPDSSVVMLNANSTISYNERSFLQQREVWIAGEAFFTIAKQWDADSTLTDFSVRTEDLSVNVLGTKFNVNTHRESTKVILSEGSVKLVLPQGASTKSVLMKPGEMVTFASHNQTLEKTVVNPTKRTAWQQNELVFNDTPVQEIIHTLEDTYGWQITVQNQRVLSRGYTGTFQDPDPEIILMALETLFDLEIEYNGNRIIIK
ncbi:MAG: FecR domain-containing protein [Bacteroidota bacterium]